MMKKYWSLLVVFGVVVVTFGLHYAQVVSAKIQKEITFETLIGDEQYVNNVTIEGGLSSDTDYKDVLISNGETKIQYNTMYERYTPQLYASLINDYKRFMRGKILDPSHYYEDDEQLVYVKEPDDIWKLSAGDRLVYEIDVLNKATKDSHSFTVHSKLEQDAHWITLEKAVVVGNELKVLTKHVSDSRKEVVHLTTFDMKKEQMVDDIILDTIQSTDAIYMNVSLYNEYFHIGHENYVVYNISKYNERSESSIPISDRYFALNLETNAVTEIDMPEQIFGYAYNIVVHEHQLIATTIKDEKIVLNRYNIGQQQWLEPMTIDVPFNVREQEQFELHTLNGKLYVLVQTAEGPLLTIVDALSGDTLYSGLVKIAINQPNISLIVSHIYETNN